MLQVEVTKSALRRDIHGMGVTATAALIGTGQREGVVIPSSKGLDREQWLMIFGDLADGVVRALEDVYDAIGPRLYGLALWRTGSAEDAADVVQDVFVQLAEYRHRLRAVKKPERWLMTLTHRRAIDCVRRRGRRDADFLDETLFLTAMEMRTELAIDAGRASRCLAQLPPQQREVIFLRHFEDCTFKTIGRIVGIPTFTAASRYRLGMARLRRLMGAPDEK